MNKKKKKKKINLLYTKLYTLMIKAKGKDKWHIERVISILMEQTIDEKESSKQKCKRRKKYTEKITYKNWRNICWLWKRAERNQT